MGDRFFYGSAIVFHLRECDRTFCGEKGDRTFCGEKCDPEGDVGSA